MSQHPERPRRPALTADLSRVLHEVGGDPAQRLEAAHATAGAVLEAGRSGRADTQVLIGLADVVGLEELADLWSAAEPASLPSTLWKLYLLRTWCHRHPRDVTRLFRAGSAHAEVAALVAGLPAHPGPEDVPRFGDALLRGVYDGDPADALERAAAFCRVAAAGHGDDVDSTDVDPWASALRGARILTTAAHLDAAAAAWRAGGLH